jgi:hypothetical protein
MKEAEMRKVGLTLLMIILAAATALSQRPTAGQDKSASLKGVTKVYLRATGYNAYQGIVGEIKKSLPDLIFTSRPEDAEVWLSFNVVRGNVSHADPGLGLIATQVPITLRYETVATGEIVKPLAKDRVQKLLNYKDSSEDDLPNRFITKFARKFVKLYRKANP